MVYIDTYLIFAGTLYGLEEEEVMVAPELIITHNFKMFLKLISGHGLNQYTGKSYLNSQV